METRENSKVNVLDKFQLFDELWSPKIVAELNGQHVKVAKVQGEFVWHSHEREDELFYVVKGELTIQFRDRSVELKAGEFLVVPNGVEHAPKADEEAWILLFEPASTVNTGNVLNETTKKDLDRL